MNIIFFVAKYITKNIFFYLFIGSSLVIIYQHSKIERLTFNCQLKEQKLEAIEKESDAYSMRLIALQEKLKEEEENSRLSAERILSQKVTDDCEKTLYWAIDQTKYLK